MVFSRSGGRGETGCLVVRFSRGEGERFGQGGSFHGRDQGDFFQEVV
ncbi:hypothetical protein B005_4622 [Nocardiopsis alba ATCC BAA-2165]|uniref:Uncharacterized protein n=1 Tax=Nocardiopsis alba (strain ATCC BAA-2165 / BE74) TaxID=1205910 RepID=J7L2V8_NOCAA|nr:hypothetical protein B005_4622 [Nocardiopsis alba ATCC BAA-2165]